jgi:hypothetical protein
VKLIQRDGDHWLFKLRRQEKVLLLDLLQFYPMLEASFQPLSKNPTPAVANADPELKEALAAQKEENKKFLAKLFGEGSGFTAIGKDFHLQLSAEQVEMLLQVLNDIRVGCWRNLGSPDYHKEHALAPTEENLRQLQVMELCGLFEGQLLEALT